MKIYDISMDIHYDMMVYKNKDENRPVKKVTRDFSSGDSYESSMLIPMHTGTHVDAPLHMIENGSTIESIDLSKVVRPCRVFDFREVKGRITKDDLVKRDIGKGDFILLKTQNSYTEEFEYEYIYLEKSGAEYLRYIGVTGVGIDSLGIERSQPGHDTHKILLGSHIVILEGLRLKGIEEGEYFLYAPPLKITGSEASPVRAVLVKL